MSRLRVDRPAELVGEHEITVDVGVPGERPLKDLRFAVGAQCITRDGVERDGAPQPCRFGWAEADTAACREHLLLNREPPGVKVEAAPGQPGELTSSHSGSASSSGRRRSRFPGPSSSSADRLRELGWEMNHRVASRTDDGDAVTPRVPEKSLLNPSASSAGATAEIYISESHACYFPLNLVAILAELRAALGVLAPAGVGTVTGWN